MNIYLTYISSKGAKDFLFAHTNFVDAMMAANNYGKVLEKGTTLRTYKVEEGLVEYLNKDNVVHEVKG